MWLKYKKIMVETRQFRPSPVRLGWLFIIWKESKWKEIEGRGNVSATIVGNELSAGMYIYTLIVDGTVVDTNVWSYQVIQIHIIDQSDIRKVPQVTLRYFYVQDSS